MADRSNANRLAPVGELIDDPVGADPQRVEPPELSPERITGKRVTLEQSKRILDGVDQRPAQLKQVTTGSPSKDESGQRSAGAWPALGELTAKLGEGERLPPLNLGKPRLQRADGIRIGEDLGGLLQSLVLVDRNQNGGRSPIAGDQDVISSITDVVQQAAEVAAQLSDGHDLSHVPSVHYRVHTSSMRSRHAEGTWTQSGQGVEIAGMRPSQRIKVGRWQRRPRPRVASASMDKSTSSSC